MHPPAESRRGEVVQSTVFDEDRARNIGGTHITMSANARRCCHSSHSEMTALERSVASLTG